MASSSASRQLRVAYLVNLYPSLSHGFIRREIAALEARRVSVRRVSIRADGVQGLTDPDDVAEASRTEVLLERGAWRLAHDTLAVLATRPLVWCQALAAALALGWRTDRGMLRHLAYFVEACALIRTLAADPVVHVHAHFGTNPAAVALLCRELGGPPFSFTAHGTESFERPEAVKLCRKAARARFVVAVCEWGREQIRRACWAGEACRVEVVRCGLDDAFLAAPPTPVPAGGRLVCVARLSPEKGIPVLLDAAAILAREGRALELVLAGGGPLREALVARVAALGLEGRVRFTGPLSALGVRQAIQEARALVLPSLAEGLPVVLMEAFAMARPVVATTVGGIAELVEPGASGWLVPPGSAEALAGALREVLAASAERLGEMGLRGRERVLERHDASREAARLAALFAESAAAAGGTS